MKKFKRLLSIISFNSFLKEASNIFPDTDEDKVFEVFERGLKVTNTLLALYDKEDPLWRATMTTGAMAIAACLHNLGELNESIEALRHAKICLSEPVDKRENGSSFESVLNNQIDSLLAVNLIRHAANQKIMGMPDEQVQSYINEAKPILSKLLLNESEATAAFRVEKALSSWLLGEEELAKQDLMRAFRMGDERTVLRATGTLFRESWVSKYVPIGFSELATAVASKHENASSPT